MAIRSRAAGRSTVRLTVVPARWRMVPAAVAAWLLVAALPTEAEADLPRLGAPAPNFALTTQQNDRLWLTQLRGRAVVLAFGCAACGVCPDLVPRLDNLARSLGDAPGRRVFFLLVTVDPARDTQTVLREFGRARGLRAPAWLLLTEDRPGQTEAVARRYGVTVRPGAGGRESECVVTLIDAAGRIRARHGLGSLEALRGDLRTLLGMPASP
jgi:cytochrome oxidase Cu insertion factor (SCO1/SenC/PrrC family)